MGLTNGIQEKTVKVLEYFLSLHEADEIFNMISNERYTEKDLIQKLDEYRDDDQEIEI